MPIPAPQALCAKALLGVFGFWVGMSVAGRSYPSEYDWRYMTISSLVYGERNPHGYLWARAGIALCGLAGVYWAMVVIRASAQTGVARRPIGIWALGLGYLFMIGCALLPEGVRPLAKAHDFLALTAFLGICVGMVHSTFKVLERRGRPGNPVRSPALSAGILAGIVLSPIVLAALAQTYVSHALPTLPWVSLAWRARGVPIYLSFAFWEWLTCAVFSVYMVVLSQMTLAAVTDGEAGTVLIPGPTAFLPVRSAGKSSSRTLAESQLYRRCPSKAGSAGTSAERGS